MTTLILTRHGQSQWNLENRFTGWVDVDLTPEGEAQAVKAGELIKETGVHIDRAYTSVLTRAIRTCNIALDAASQSFVPVTKDWRLNERHYGALTGLNKAETATQYGAEQVYIWRRSFAIRPPLLALEDERSSHLDVRYQKLDPNEIPRGECLQDTIARVLPLWHESIAPALKLGKRVLLVAHGNSIRALMKHLDNISAEAIMELNIPNGKPIVYELNDDLQPLQHFYIE